MAARRVRVEFIRFGLLLTLTVALLSVAARHGDHHNGRSQAARGPQHSSTASPSSGGTTSSSSPGQSTQPTPSASAHASSAPGAAEGSGSSGSGSNGAGQESGVATLPRTGPAQAAKLAALAGLFIAVGSFSVRISRRPATAAQGAAPSASAQPEQAFGSSESNRPGTV